MARGPCTFKQQDVTRALLAAKKAGVDITRIKIGKDGSIEIDTGKSPEINEDIDRGDIWDAATKQ
jgi:hypothetical protein